MNATGITQHVLMANKLCTTGLEPIQLTPPARGGRRDPVLGTDGMEVVEIETESTTAVAAMDIAAVEAGTVIATETEIENTAVTITNEGADAKRETRTVAAETETAIEKKRITENGEGRGTTT